MPRVSATPPPARPSRVLRCRFAHEKPRRPRRSGAAELTALTQAVATSAVDEAAGVDPANLDDLERRLVDTPPRASLVRVWWSGLSEGARAALGERAPLAIGNLDGVPWPARVEANHRTLAALIARRADSGLRARDRRVAHDHLIARRLEALAGGPGVVARDGRARFLLAFDPDRRAIIEFVAHAIADTDDPFASPLPAGLTSLAVFVPGNDSDLAQFEGKVHTMSELVHTGDPGTTGLIVWQGGVFPRGPFGLSSATAFRLAPRLGRFVNAIPRDPAVRVVAYGFSFGGSVVGTAMRLGMRVDAVMHVASAGLGPGVRSLHDYPASARVPHTSMLAPGDREVAPFLGIDLPPGGRGIGHGADPTAVPGITRLETGFLRAVAPGGDVAAGRRAGILRGHASLLERWNTTAKHAMRAMLDGGEAELAAPRTRLERASERLGLPWSPLQRPGYEPRFVTLAGRDSPASLENPRT